MKKLLPQTLVARGIPALIVLLSIIPFFISWWQFIHPASYYQFVYRHYPQPSDSVLAEALLYSGVFGIGLATLFATRWGYILTKWLLIVAVPVSLLILWIYLPRLWNYGTWTDLGNGQMREDPMTLRQKLADIYLLILLSLTAVGVIGASLRFWTRAEISSRFKQRLSKE